MKAITSAPMKRPKIAFITPEDQTSRKSWSGTNYFMLQSLEKHLGDVTAFGPLSAEPEWTISRILNALSLRLLKKRINYRDSAFIAKSYARRIHRLLEKADYDLIIAPAGTATIAQLSTKTPIVYINDRSIPSGIHYHPILKNLWNFSERNSLACEGKTIEKSMLTIYSSAWAADAAKKEYHTFAHKIHVIPFGANMDKTEDVVEEKSWPPAILHLFFAGVKWNEKGGPLAYQCLQYLREKAIPAQLHIAGCRPPEDVCSDADVIVHGFLNKDHPDEFEKLKTLFKSADLFILPTRFEAYGLVFCEAASYGLPALAPDTGGISTIVQNHVTGMLFDMHASAHDYGRAIQQLINDPKKFHSMRAAARRRYEEHLNWDAFTGSLKKLLEIHQQER